MATRQVRKVFSRPKAAGAHAVAALTLAAALTACESVSDLDVFGVLEESPPAATTTSQAELRSRADQVAASGGATPSLSSVPPRPESVTPTEVRQNVVEGLIADRENARYSDQSIRLQGATRESGARAEAATPATATPPPPQLSAATPDRAARPTQITPRPPVPSVSTPVPMPTGPTPSVQVDISAIEGGAAFPVKATRVTVDEQVATIYFAHSSSKLDARDKQVIVQVASAQKRNGAEVIIVGHASGRTQQLTKVEHELANLQVSMARANRVANELIAQGVAPEKVTVEALADSKPHYSEAMPTGEAGNRRAEIYFRQ